MKTSSSTWSVAKAVFVKLSTGWQQVFPGNVPAVDETDPITLRLSSYNGSVADSPQYINTILYGHDGSYTNGPVTITGRKMRVASDGDGNGTRLQIESTDIFNLSNNSETDRYYADEYYLFYELTASNSSGDLNAFSQPVKIIKRMPVITGTPVIAGTVAAYETLIFDFNAEFYWYNKPDLGASYVRWWRNTSKSPGGTILQTDYLSDDTAISRYSKTDWELIGSDSTNKPTSTINGASFYSVDPADVSSGEFIIAELVLENSYNRHYNYVTRKYFSTGTAPNIYAFNLYDTNDNTALDNQSRYPFYVERLPVNTSIRAAASINYVDANTTYRFRYRIYNTNTGAYWKPFAGTVASSASAAWQSYNSDGSGDGYLTPGAGVISGTTVEVSDYFSIDGSVFAGNTYNSGGSGYPYWQLEIEVSAVNTGFARAYWFSPINYESFDLAPGMNPTISANPTSGSTPLSVTFSGQITGDPAGSAYPRAYKIDFGDYDSTGWVSFNQNTASPTYSVSHTYYSGGSYVATIDTIPSTNTASANVEAYSVPSAPSYLTATTNREDGVYLEWQNVGANYYEIYWQSIQGGGPVNQSSFADFGQDNSITTNSYLDTSITAGNTRYYRVRARNSSTASGSASSNWTPTYGANGITGTRILVTPGTPTGLSGYGNGTGSLQTITLSWNAATNAAKYELYYNGTGTTPSDSYAADYPQSGSSDITSTTFTTPYQSFSANTTYYWWVRSVSSSGIKSTWSSRATVTTNSNILTAPTITSVSAGAAGGPVSVYFTGGSGPYYQMYWTTGVGGTGYDEYGSSSPITDQTGPSLTGYTWYAYVRSVSALTNTGTGPSSTISAWSTGYPFTVTAPNASPPAYVNAGVSANVFTVSWPAASNATKYRIYWVNSTSTSANPANSYDGETTSTSYQFTLSYNSSYYFFVSASGDNNVWTPYNSARSSQVTSGSQIVVTYGSCEAYGSSISSSSSYYCDGTYSQNYTDNTYYARRQILNNGSWTGAYDYSGCTTAVVRTLGTRSQVNGQCGYTTPTTSCTCYYSDYGSYYFSPQCCGSETTVTYTGTGSYTVNPRNCCPTVNKTSKYACNNYDVTNSASVNYYQCYSVGQCAANSNPAGTRSVCYVP